MSGLTGFDGDVVGFDSVSQDSRPSKSISSQTTEFGSSDGASQTSASKDVDCMVYPEDLNVHGDVPNEYPPPGLNEFLRRVVPAMMDQLDQNDREDQPHDTSSDSDGEELLTAKLLQEIKLKDGSGDHPSSVIDVSWSSAGNSLAVSLGSAQDDEWSHAGLVKVYTLKRSEDRFVHSLDVAEKNCVSVLSYHPAIAALLAYGTTSGEVVLCNLSGGCLDAGATLASPAGCHGCRRVTALRWADAALANTLLAVNSRGRRRGADQVLVSAGSDGSLVLWQVDAAAPALEMFASFCVNASRGPPADITCFDFARSTPLRPARDKAPGDVFVVGSKTGQLFLCKLAAAASALADAALDPVREALDAHATCVLDVRFSAQRPRLLVSLSMDAELRLYDVARGLPLKVLHLEAPVSCMSWVSGGVLLVGLAGCEELVRVYDAFSGRVVPVAGFEGGAGVNCIAVKRGGSCRIAAGDDSGAVRVWDLPTGRIKLSTHDLDIYD